MKPNKFKLKLKWREKDFTKGEQEFFTWKEAINNCPEGYHLPAAWEFATLIDDKKKTKALKFKSYDEYWSSSIYKNYAVWYTCINPDGYIHLEQNYNETDGYRVRYIKD